MEIRTVELKNTIIHVKSFPVVSSSHTVSPRKTFPFVHTSHTVACIIVFFEHYYTYNRIWLLAGRTQPHFAERVCQEGISPMVSGLCGKDPPYRSHSQGDGS